MRILEFQIIFKSLLLIRDHIIEYYEIMFTLDHSKLTLDFIDYSTQG